MKDEMFNFYKSALLGLATNKPLCEEYKNEWRSCGDDKEKLLTFSLRQQCIPFVMLYSHEGYGLDKEYLKKEYKEYINGSYTAKDCDCVKGYTYELFVDYEGFYAQKSDVLSCMYCNGMELMIPKCKCPIIFVGCNSEVHITLEGFNSPRIYLYDESKVVIDDCDETCNATIYKYSNDCKVELGKFCFGKIKEFTKELRTQL